MAIAALCTCSSVALWIQQALPPFQTPIPYPTPVKRLAESFCKSKFPCEIIDELAAMKKHLPSWYAEWLHFEAWNAVLMTIREGQQRGSCSGDNPMTFGSGACNLCSFTDFLELALQRLLTSKFCSLQQLAQAGGTSSYRCQPSR